MRRCQVIAISALWLVGCGRDSPSSSKAEPSGGTARKPCEAMARADAEAAVGLPLPKTTENVPLGMCDYMTAEFYGASLTVGEWESMKTAAQGGTGSRPPTVLTGVGDEALNRGPMIYVRKGDRGFLLHLNGPEIDHSPDRGLERTKTLAAKILPNI
jgi:hypothetical protein